VAKLAGFPTLAALRVEERTWPATLLGMTLIAQRHGAAVNLRHLRNI
jgi:hypothetical protein